MIGIGNRHAGDDAVGLEVAGRVAEATARRPGVAVRLIGGDPLALLDAWEGARAAVIVDAAHSGAAPGTIHRIEAGEVPLPAVLRSTSSTHAIGVAGAIDLARAIDRLPPRIVVYAVEGACFELGTGLSPAVGAAVPALAARVAGEAVAL